MLQSLIWPVAKRFVGGRSIPEVLEKSRALKSLGYKIILSSASEHIGHGDTSRILKVKNEYCGLIRHLDEGDKVAIKLSQFGLIKARSVSEKWEALPHLTEVLERAREKNIQVAFDAEYLTDREFYSDFLSTLWKAGFHNIERVIQAYGPSWDWGWFIDKCASVPMPARVCMGAYKSDPAAFSFKRDYNVINYQYNCAVAKFLSLGIPVEIATGNAERIDFWTKRTAHMPSARFSMLLGVRPDIARKLKETGRAPYIYLLFGSDWFPYFKRRILENPHYILLPFEKKENY